jgi:rhodanese-related sulfurtransferase
MKILTITTLLLLLSSCIEPKEATNKSQIVSSMGLSVAKQFPNVKHISIEELDKLSLEDYILVDVRSKNELNVSMIPNAITKKNFEENIDQYKNKLIITYCTIGYRSSKYSKSIQGRGLKVYNLQESILGWAMRERPLINKGQETKKVHVYSDAWNFLPKGFTGVYK